MKMWVPAMAMSVALSIGVGIPSTHARGAVGGLSGGAASHVVGGFQGNGFGFHHGFGFRTRFLPPLRPFSQPRLNFGAGFASHQSSVVTGYGGGGYGEDDIEDLHFRVQEPFGPGDIGRPPAGADEDAPYMSDRMGPWDGYAPDR